MTALARCPNGHVFPSIFTAGLTPGASVSVFGCSERCPLCGAEANSPNGVFSIADEVKRAISDPSVTRDNVVAFRDIAKSVKAGSATAEEAAAELEKINALFVNIWHFANGNAPVLALLVSILTLVVMCYTIIDSNATSAQVHSDAQAQLKATQQQTQAIASAAKAQMTLQEAQQKIDEKLVQLNALAQAQAMSPQPRSPRKPGAQARKPTTGVSGNRHERLKAARLAKRASKRQPLN